MNKPDLGKAMLGGFLGTLAMTVLFWGGKVAGLPDLDLAAIVGAIFNGGLLPATASTAWWAGLFVHFVLGVWLLPLGYVCAFYPIYWGPPVLRGILYAIGLWIVMSLLMLPMMQLGVFGFKTVHPMWFLGSFFLIHVLYGAILGVVAGGERSTGNNRSTAAPV